MYENNRRKSLKNCLQNTTQKTKDLATCIHRYPTENWGVNSDTLEVPSPHRKKANKTSTRYIRIITLQFYKIKT